MNGIDSLDVMNGKRRKTLRKNVYTGIFIFICILQIVLKLIILTGHFTKIVIYTFFLFHEIYLYCNLLVVIK